MVRRYLFLAGTLAALRAVLFPAASAVADPSALGPYGASAYAFVRVSDATHLNPDSVRDEVSNDPFRLSAGADVATGLPGGVAGARASVEYNQLGFGMRASVEATVYELLPALAESATASASAEWSDTLLVTSNTLAAGTPVTLRLNTGFGAAFTAHRGDPVSSCPHVLFSGQANAGASLRITSVNTTNEFLRVEQAYACEVDYSTTGGNEIHTFVGDKLSMRAMLTASAGSQRGLFAALAATGGRIASLNPVTVTSAPVDDPVPVAFLAAPTTSWRFAIDPESPGVSLVSASGYSYLTPTVAPPPPLDLWVDDAEPVQVVYGVPLIKGKPTAVHAYVRANTCEALAGALPNGLTVRVAHEETSVSKTLEASDFVPDDGLSCLAEAIVVWPTPPAVEGPFDIRVTVDSENTVAEQVETNNDWQKSFDVTTGGRLRLLYVRIPNCNTGCYGAATMPVEETIQQSNELISTLFPVSPQDFSGPLSSRSLRGSSAIGDPGLVSDLRAVKRLGVRVDPLADRFLGMVPGDYFTYHGLDADIEGLSIPGVPDTVLIENSSVAAAAHELGHTFGLWDFIERYNLPWSTVVQEGFWVQRITPVVNATSMMGRDVVDIRAGLHGYWIEYQDYVDLAAALPRGSDPEALLISGVVQRSGVVSLDPLLYLPEAMLDESPHNAEADRTLTIRMLDQAGTVVAQHVRPLLFMRRGDNGNEEADTVPFAVRLAFPPTASTLEVRVDDQVALHVDANIQTLSDALTEVPVELFQKPGENRRRALLNKIESLGRQVSKKESLNKLVNDIRPHLMAWLLADRPADPLLLSRSDVLAIIDALITRWSAQ